MNTNLIVSNKTKDWAGKRILIDSIPNNLLGESLDWIVDNGAAIQLFEPAQKIDDTSDIILLTGTSYSLIDDPKIPVILFSQAKSTVCHCDKLSLQGTKEEIINKLSGWKDVSKIFRREKLENSPTINVETLKKLEALGGKGIAQDGIQLFLRTIGNQLNRTGKEIPDADLNNLLRMTHTIKGSAGTIGAERLSSAAKSWENRLIQGILYESQEHLALMIMLLRYFEYSAKNWV